MTKDEIELYKYSKTNFQDEIECWGYWIWTIKV